MFSRSIYCLRFDFQTKQIKCLRLRHKINKQEEKAPSKLAADVVNYVNTMPEYQEIKDKIPNQLLRKYKKPESMYLINKATAKEVAKTFHSYLDSDLPIVEVNPGFGFLTAELLKSNNHHKIHLYESSQHFSEHITNLEIKYPGSISYKIADFFGMWKPAFQDKMDQGNRIQELLGDLATEDNDRVVKIIGAMPGLGFVKHLIMNLVFHNTTNQLGRPDLFITMPGHHYEFLADNKIKMGKHQSVPALFQMLFDYKILGSVPKVHFLPWSLPSSMKRVTMMDEHRMYLVNITQKLHLPCPAEYLPLLWYFFKPQTFSKSTRVIPMLEQWIPGCGVWLITEQDPPDSNKKIAPTNEDEKLPHMTIFTEFGDLTLRQKITVFKKFVSWPEFEQCPFRVTMESNLPKSVSQIDNDEDKASIAHMDDIDQSDAENDPTLFEK